MGWALHISTLQLTLVVYLSYSAYMELKVCTKAHHFQSYWGGGAITVSHPGSTPASSSTLYVELAGNYVE